MIQSALKMSQKQYLKNSISKIETCPHKKHSGMYTLTTETIYGFI